MKKTSLFLLIICIVISTLTACNNGNNTENTSKSEQDANANQNENEDLQYNQPLEDGSYECKSVDELISWMLNDADTYQEGTSKEKVDRLIKNGEILFAEYNDEYVLYQVSFDNFLNAVKYRYKKNGKGSSISVKLVDDDMKEAAKKGIEEYNKEYAYKNATSREDTSYLENFIPKYIKSNNGTNYCLQKISKTLWNVQFITNDKYFVSISIYNNPEFDESWINDVQFKEVKIKK